MLVAAVRGVGMMATPRSWLAWIGFSPSRESYESPFIWDQGHVLRLNNLSVNIEELEWSYDRQLASFAYFPGKDNEDTVLNRQILIWHSGRIIFADIYPASALDMDWSRGGHLAYLSYAPTADHYSEIFVWDGSQAINVSDSSGNMSAPVWSEDGRLAWLQDSDSTNEVFVWDGTHSVNASRSSLQENFHHWTTDGRLVWVACEGTAGVDYPNQVHQWYTACSDQLDEWYIWDGERLNTIDQSPFSTGIVHWSNSGRAAWLNFDNDAEFRASLYVWDSGVVKTVGQFTFIDVWSVQWSHDEHLAWMGSNPDNSSAPTEIYVWDRDVTTRVTHNHETEHSLSWSRDGRLAWIEGADMAEVYVWENGSMQNVAENRNGKFSLRWSPDGRLAWVEQSLKPGLSQVVVWDGLQTEIIWEGVVTNNSATWSPLPP